MTVLLIERREDGGGSSKWFRLRSIKRWDENPSLSNMGEGFFNRGCIVVEKNPILDMKGLSYSMSSSFD